jgi:hypothetical protein
MAAWQMAGAGKSAIKRADEIRRSPDVRSLQICRIEGFDTAPE